MSFAVTVISDEHQTLASVIKGCPFDPFAQTVDSIALFYGADTSHHSHGKRELSIGRKVPGAASAGSL